MRILSFDTSTSALHIALLQDRQPIWAEIIEPPLAERQAAGCLLMPAINRAIKAVEWDKRSLDFMVVNIGPGSFTGVRVGVITGRTIADRLKVPLAGVCLLETAYASLARVGGAAVENRCSAIILATSSSQFFFAAYQATASDPACPVVAPACGALEAMLERLQAATSLYGDDKTLACVSDARLQSLPIIKNVAVNQAQLAYDRLSLKRLDMSNGEMRDTLLAAFPWQTVVPLYLRSPSITQQGPCKS